MVFSLPMGERLSFLAAACRYNATDRLWEDWESAAVLHSRIPIWQTMDLNFSKEVRVKSNFIRKCAILSGMFFKKKHNPADAGFRKEW